jgi:hypothetical protein
MLEIARALSLLSKMEALIAVLELFAKHWPQVCITSADSELESCGLRTKAIDRNGRWHLRIE